MSFQAQQFKQVLRQWPSGVTIVTSRAGERIHGMTVSAFSSVSADPPLVSICANRGSATHAVIAEGGVFAVHILGAEHQDLSTQFSSSKFEKDRFVGLTHSAGVTGAPILEGVLGHLECEVAAAHDEGSHTIFLGRVVAGEAREGAPLVYFNGAYRRLEP